ncbi:MAG: hypothetical protein HRT88_08780 [Lentisphaeraceae bacterium]|nr:hypothetical protein [Lentisphaeraceae bacterium]
MSVSRSNACRDVPERLTVGLDLKINGGEETMRVYLKRHWKDKKGKNGKPENEAQLEFDNINTLENQGVKVPRAMAVGHGSINGRPVGFMMVQEVSGIPCDDYIKDKFPQQALSGDALIAKRRLISQLAQSSAKFHNLGFNHRDFYLCHTFIKEDGADFLFHLIDLQRVQKRKLLRYRWLVKDLAQMNYSAPTGVSNTDRLRFYFDYSGIKTLSKKDKKFIAVIWHKVMRLRKRELQGKNR